MTEYYIIPDIDALDKEKDPELLRKHRRRIAANIGDPDALRAILGDASEDFGDFYGDSELPNLSTEDTIDSFLQRFGQKNAVATVDTGTPEESESPVVPVIPVVPAADYMASLESMPEVAADDTGADNTLGAIDAFLEKVPAQRAKPKKEIKEPEMPSLTEGFAKIMIKNGNYSRALEIITQISLNNPEKSIYFADQIRFLKKVILIQGHKEEH
ncbi:MAG: hypothetical protein NC095_05385 [Muribaculum sp.]|nr:hypothetical protein [Muribaculum sp.]